MFHFVSRSLVDICPAEDGPAPEQIDRVDPAAEVTQPPKEVPASITEVELVSEKKNVKAPETQPVGQQQEPESQPITHQPQVSEAPPTNTDPVRLCLFW